MGQNRKHDPVTVQSTTQAVCLANYTALRRKCAEQPANAPHSWLHLSAHCFPSASPTLLSKCKDGRKVVHWCLGPLTGSGICGGVPRRSSRTLGCTALLRLVLSLWASEAALGTSDLFFFLPLGSVQKTADQNNCFLWPIQ